MEIFGWVCLSAFLFAPVVTFIIGYKLGKGGLPYKLVRTDQAQNGGGYYVED